MIIITGGAGFIGSHLCENLIKNGEKIICIDNFNEYYDPMIKENNIKTLISNDRFQLFKGDIRDMPFLEKIFSENRVEMVINLAAMAGVRPSLEDPLLYEEVNIKGLMNILELCKKYKINKFIQASSSSVYGNNSKVPFSENDVVDYAISPYAATKKSGEILGHVFHHLYNIDMIQLRFFTVYGPRQRPDLAIHKFTKFITEGKAVPVYGDGSSERDYTYIDDILDGIIKSIDYLRENQGIYHILNLGESETISLNKMIQVIQDELGIKAIINHLPLQPGDVNKTYADISKAKKLLGYSPKTNFKNGIKNFISWYQEFNELKKTSLR
ncbi:SDR family NAD(P)-dependent oxidoreductase [uncultured Ilyobacter sp.]|uniref:SDR family NAD(P)-dependent oxidoreductase n=1 Tax=uncultured Ilyobacter sp. TaxID=544433 RepID=UPI0029BFEABA|nr:SDR family NAD(P)-dependent oxidoreductase [uncultured Ilyobacter sp.]